MYTRLAHARSYPLSCKGKGEISKPSTVSIPLEVSSQIDISQIQILLMEN